TELEKALKIYPQDISAYHYLGMSYFRLQKYSKALKYLAPYGEAQAKDKKIHYYLGASYEGLRDLRRAYNEYNLQLRVAPRNEEGRLAESRVVALKHYIDAEDARRRREQNR
ncbi:MAG: tetratricopeptide repeat protein, partial [Thermodesulfobacteriota bacterium]